MNAFLQIIQAIIGIGSAIDQQNQARKVANRNADMVIYEAGEAIRRTKRRNEYLLGQARAQLGDSGVYMKSGTAYDYLKGTEKEMQKQINWMTMQALVQKDIIKKTHKAQGKAASYSTLGSTISSFGNSYTGGYSTGSTQPATGGFGNMGWNYDAGSSGFGAGIGGMPLGASGG